MLRWTLIFLAAAIIAAALGFTEVAGALAGLARTFFYVFLVLFVITSLLHLLRSSEVD